MCTYFSERYLELFKMFFLNRKRGQNIAIHKAEQDLETDEYQSLCATSKMIGSCKVNFRKKARNQELVI